MKLPNVEHVCAELSYLPNIIGTDKHLPKRQNTAKNDYVSFLLLTSSQERAAFLSKKLDNFDYWRPKKYPPKDTRTLFVLTSVNCVRDFAARLSFDNTHLVIIDTECFGAYKHAPPVLFSLIHDHFSNGRINLCLLLSDLTLSGSASNPEKNRAYQQVEMCKNRNDAAKKKLEKARKKKGRVDEKHEDAKHAQEAAENVMKQAMTFYLSFDEQPRQRSFMSISVVSREGVIDVDALDYEIGETPAPVPTEKIASATRNWSKKERIARKGDKGGAAKSLRKETKKSNQAREIQEKQSGKMENLTRNLRIRIRRRNSTIATRNRKVNLIQQLNRLPYGAAIQQIVYNMILVAVLGGLSFVVCLVTI